MFVRTLSLPNVDSLWAVKEKFQTQLLNSSWGSQAIALAKRLQSGGLSQNSLFKRVTQFAAADCFVVRHRLSMLAGGLIVVGIVVFIVKSYINPPESNNKPETPTSTETNHDVVGALNGTNMADASNTAAAQGTPITEISASNLEAQEPLTGDGDGSAAAQFPAHNEANANEASNAAAAQGTPITEISASNLEAQEPLTGDGDGSAAAQSPAHSEANANEASSGAAAHGTSASDLETPTEESNADLQDEEPLTAGNGDGSAAAPAKKPKRRMGSFQNPELGLDTLSPRKSTNPDCAIM